jgi:hypothetical protein
VKLDPNTAEKSIWNPATGSALKGAEEAGRKAPRTVETFRAFFSSALASKWMMGD